MQRAELWKGTVGSTYCGLPAENYRTGWQIQNQSPCTRKESSSDRSRYRKLLHKGMFHVRLPTYQLRAVVLLLQCWPAVHNHVYIYLILHLRLGGRVRTLPPNRLCGYWLQHMLIADSWAMIYGWNMPIRGACVRRELCVCCIDT